MAQFDGIKDKEVHAQRHLHLSLDCICTEAHPHTRSCDGTRKTNAPGVLQLSHATNTLFTIRIYTYTSYIREEHTHTQKPHKPCPSTSAPRSDRRPWCIWRRPYSWLPRTKNSALDEERDWSWKSYPADLQSARNWWCWWKMRDLIQFIRVDLFRRMRCCVWALSCTESDPHNTWMGWLECTQKCIEIGNWNILDAWHNPGNAYTQTRTHTQTHKAHHTQVRTQKKPRRFGLEPRIGLIQVL